jgi:hypothetical protein
MDRVHLNEKRPLRFGATCSIYKLQHLHIDIGRNSLAGAVYLRLIVDAVGCKSSNSESHASTTPNLIVYQPPDPVWPIAVRRQFSVPGLSVDATTRIRTSLNHGSRRSSLCVSKSPTTDRARTASCMIRILSLPVNAGSFSGNVQLPSAKNAQNFRRLEAQSMYN